MLIYFSRFFVQKLWPTGQKIIIEKEHAGFTECILRGKQYVYERFEDTKSSTGGTDFRSDRREFLQGFLREELSKVLCGRKIVQIKHSCVLSNGAILGLNYQTLPFSKIKPQKCGKE